MIMKSGENNTCKKQSTQIVPRFYFQKSIGIVGFSPKYQENKTKLHVLNMYTKSVNQKKLSSDMKIRYFSVIRNFIDYELSKYVTSSHYLIVRGKYLKTVNTNT